MTNLFVVYGTLKSGYGNHRLLDNKADVAFKGRVVSQDRYIVRGMGFPLAIKNGEEELKKPLQGELYEVNNEEVVQSLDWLESNGSFYTREIRPFTTDNGETVEAWIYLIGEDGYQGNALCPTADETYYWGSEVAA